MARRGPLYRNVLYIKPVQTGYPDDSDGAHVANVGGGTYEAMPHAAAAGIVSKPPASIPREGGGLLCRTIFAWKRAVGPHLAAASEGRAVSDDELVAAVRQALRISTILATITASSHDNDQDEHAAAEQEKLVSRMRVEANGEEELEEEEEE